MKRYRLEVELKPTVTQIVTHALIGQSAETAEDACRQAVAQAMLVGLVVKRIKVLSWRELPESGRQVTQNPLDGVEEIERGE